MVNSDDEYVAPERESLVIACLYDPVTKEFREHDDGPHETRFHPLWMDRRLVCRGQAHQPEMIFLVGGEWPSAVRCKNCGETRSTSGVSARYRPLQPMEVPSNSKAIIDQAGYVWLAGRRVYVEAR